MSGCKGQPEGAKLEITAVAHVTRTSFYFVGDEVRERGESPTQVFYARGPNRLSLAEAMQDLRRFEDDG